MTTALPIAMPKTRGECENGVRPCPFVSCRYHLAIDVDPRTGALTESLPFDEDGAPADVTESCVLDVADRSKPPILAEIASFYGLSLERVRQIEAEAGAKMKRRLDRDMLEAWTSTQPIIPDARGEDVIDAEFKAAVHRAYLRIVPERERGAKAIRVGRKSP